MERQITYDECHREENASVNACAKIGALPAGASRQPLCRRTLRANAFFTLFCKVSRAARARRQRAYSRRAKMLRAGGERYARAQRRAAYGVSAICREECMMTDIMMICLSHRYISLPLPRAALFIITCREIFMDTTPPADTFFPLFSSLRLLLYDIYRHIFRHARRRFARRLHAIYHASPRGLRHQKIPLFFFRCSAVDVANIADENRRYDATPLVHAAKRTPQDTTRRRFARYQTASAVQLVARESPVPRATRRDSARKNRGCDGDVISSCGSYAQ